MRIVLAEDSILLREGLVGLLERVGHEVAHVTDDADELVRLVLADGAHGELPDLVITDVRMPPRLQNDGIDAAAELRRHHPALPVVLLSQYVADAYARDLLSGSSGGIGYLLKDRIGRVSDVMASLEVVAAGGTVIDPQIVRSLLDRSSSPLGTLTPREREVLALMAEGRSNPEIAERLVVSDAAVAKHIGNVFAKLGLTVDDAGHRRVRAVLAYLRG
ncbi:response regulator transcription factor [Promicromonospora sp. NPDC023987]|uniref:response regulator transcription factor n=1 Tax=Promicromonospora sp. NPDC023987 TaxID=3155360 RepID=UPI0033E22420